MGGEVSSEMLTIIFLQIAILTFPLGYCAAVMAGFGFYILSGFFGVDFGIFEVCSTLALMVFVGYMQWFVFLPKLICFIKGKSKR